MSRHWLHGYNFREPEHCLLKVPSDQGASAGLPDIAWLLDPKGEENWRDHTGWSGATREQWGRVPSEMIDQLMLRRGRSPKAAAATCLAFSPDPDAVDRLVVLACDCDEYVREYAVAALTLRGESRVVEALLGILAAELNREGSVSVNVCRHAVRCVTRRGELDVVVPALLRTMTSRDGEIWAAARFAMVSLGKRAVPHLLASADHAEFRIRAEVIYAAGDSLHEELWHHVVGGLADAEYEVRLASMVALAAWDRPGTVAMILGQHDYKPTFGLAECLGALSDPAALEPLTALLIEEDPWIRFFAALGIANVSDRATHRRLGSVATGRDPEWPAEFFPPDRIAALQRASADERGCYVESDPMDWGRFDPPMAHWTARDVLKRLTREGVPAGEG